MSKYSIDLLHAFKVKAVRLGKELFGMLESRRYLYNVQAHVYAIQRSLILDSKLLDSKNLLLKSSKNVFGECEECGHHPLTLAGQLVAHCHQLNNNIK